MNTIWGTPFAEDYISSQQILIKCANDPDIDSRSVFLALIEIPRNLCTIATPGRWVLRVSYHSETADGVAIDTKAIGKYDVREYIALDHELNFPLREVNLNGVYWCIQKIMQRRMA